MKGEKKQPSAVSASKHPLEGKIKKKKEGVQRERGGNTRWKKLRRQSRLILLDKGKEKSENFQCA